MVHKHPPVMSPLTSIGLEEKVCTTLGTVGSGEGTGQDDLNSCFLDPWADTENKEYIHFDIGC